MAKKAAKSAKTKRQTRQPAKVTRLLTISELLELPSVLNSAGSQDHKRVSEFFSSGTFGAIEQLVAATMLHLATAEEVACLEATKLTAHSIIAIDYPQAYHPLAVLIKTAWNERLGWDYFKLDKPIISHMNSSVVYLCWPDATVAAMIAKALRDGERQSESLPLTRGLVDILQYARRQDRSLRDMLVTLLCGMVKLSWNPAPREQMFQNGKGPQPT